MKKLFTAILFSVVLAGAGFAQTVVKAELSGGSEGRGDKPRIAVIEFTEANFPKSGNANDLKQISLGVVAEMSMGRPVHDWIEASATSPIVRDHYSQYLGRPIDPAGAARIGKLLGVNYVMTGHVKVIDGTKITIESQLVNSVTGLVEWHARSTYTGATYINNGSVDLTEKVLKPAIQRLTASLKAADL